MKNNVPNFPPPDGIDEWVDGQIYYTTYPDKYIFRYDVSHNYRNFIVVDEPKFYKQEGSKGSSSPWSADRTRIASVDEQDWFFACESAGETVPFKQHKQMIKVNYETILGETRTETVEGPVETVWQKVKDWKKTNYFITQ